MSSMRSKSGRVKRHVAISRSVSGGTGKSSPRAADRSRRSIRIIKGSGNVFLDVGFPAAEAENLRLRSSLMIELRDHLDALQLTQTQAAKLLGVTQPRISYLTRGRIDRFSVDTLIAMLGRVGKTLTITVR